MENKRSIKNKRATILSRKKIWFPFRRVSLPAHCTITLVGFDQVIPGIAPHIQYRGIIISKHQCGDLCVLG